MKPAADTRKPYSGNTRALVIALDVGTTFSGVSYAILEPGEVPKIHGVTRFPGQEHVAGNSKIPSVMYYDKRGKMQAAGAEAESASVLSQAEDEGWIKAELFKLRLRPKTMKLQMNGMQLGPLPRNKTSVDVFGDFLAYLFRCTRSFITDTHANGPALWNAVQNDMQFVLSHPNGWEGAQQTKMRRAAVYGGLIPDTDEGKARVRFVTEGEASLHACVLNGLAADVLSNPSRHGFLVADAGGGTLDISSYAIRGTVPLVIEEIAPPDCVFSGSVFVSRRARAFLQDKLKNSKYGTADAVDHITKRFDETTKRLFRDKNDLQFIPFGSPLDKDLSVGIRGGQLKLTGTEVAELFEPSIEAAVASIRAQIEASQGVVRSVWLVGGFAASPWLFSQLQERLTPLRVTVSRPDSQTSKAVADGAIGFYSDHHVSARMSKFMYGVEFLREYDSRDQEHVARKSRLCELPSGPRLLPDAFDCILARSVKVKESTVFSRKYCTELTSLSSLAVFEVEVWCYRGGNTIPQWILRQAEEFSTLCVVRADLSPLSGSAQSKQGTNGKTYWTIVFSVEIHFGLTEFRARIKWTDNGRTRYGPASIVYNESGSRGDEEDADSAPEDDSNSAPPRSRLASRGQSPASFATNNTYVNKLGSAVEFPKTDSVIGTPNPEATRGFERERTTSRGLPASSSTPLTSADRGRSRRESERELGPITAKDKGKERERTASGVGDRYVPPHSRTTSTTSKIGEALTEVWGAPKASPSASPLIDSTRPSQSASAKVATPQVDLSKPVTPKEKTREPTRLGDRIAAAEKAAGITAETLPSQIDTASFLAAVTEPPLSTTWGNSTSWGDNTASNYAVTGSETKIDKPVEEPPPDNKKAKKKAEKTPSKIASRAASTGPTPGAITPNLPKERSPSNDWAKLGDMTANTTDPVTVAFADASASPDHGHVDSLTANEGTQNQSGGWGAAETSGTNSNTFLGSSAEKSIEQLPAVAPLAANSDSFWDNDATYTEAPLPAVDSSAAQSNSFWGSGGGGWGTSGLDDKSVEDKAKDAAHMESEGDWGTSGTAGLTGKPPKDKAKDAAHMESEGDWGTSGTAGLTGKSPKDKAKDAVHAGSGISLGTSAATDITNKSTKDQAKAKDKAQMGLQGDRGTDGTTDLIDKPSSSWGGLGDSWDPKGSLGDADQTVKDTSKDPLTHESSGPDPDSWTTDYLSAPPASGANASSSRGLTDLSDALGLGKSSPTLKASHTSKQSSPKPALNPLATESDANKPGVNIEQTPVTPVTPATADPLVVADAKTADKNEEIDENLGPNGKPLSAKQRKELKKKKEKEAKEKADREFQEQLEKDLVEEANANNPADDDGWNTGQGGSGEWDVVGSAEANLERNDNNDRGSPMVGDEDMNGDGKKSRGENAEDEKKDGENKKDEENQDGGKKEEEKEDWGLPVKKGKKKKGKK